MMEIMDAYCERVGPGLLAEPLNAVSNVSFLLAAWAAWVLATRTGALSAGVRVLIALAASVGIGSILWHTYPTMFTLVLDSVPILVFISWYIWLYARNVIGMRSLFAVACVGAYLLATFVAIQYSGVLHGALVYVPSLMVPLVFGVFHASERMVARFTLLAAAGFLWQLSFSARLIMRSVPSCRSVPITFGTFSSDLLRTW